jgi:hypothetical protein
MPTEWYVREILASGSGSSWGFPIVSPGAQLDGYIDRDFDELGPSGATTGHAAPVDADICGSDRDNGLLREDPRCRDERPGSEADQSHDTGAGLSDCTRPIASKSSGTSDAPPIRAASNQTIASIGTI